MGNEIEKLQKIIDESRNIVFFGGAGVSTESGIPDFRSQDGLYNQKYDYPPETILSHTFFMRKPEEFFKFYRDKMLCDTAKPNAAHLKLAEMEQTGKLKAVITQNIDNLHQMAGSKKVLELHGSVYRNHCMKCGKFYDFKYMKESKGVPRCSCGGMIKPDVVLYEEGLDDYTIQESVRVISEAEVLIIGGTSLAVYPAAGLIDYFSGADEKTVIVFFGDHQPSDTVAAPILAMNGMQWNALDEEQQKLRYQVPYVIWANYDIDEEQNADTSANYLGAEVLKRAGVPTDAYQNFLLTLKESYPVISAVRTVEADGSETPAKEEHGEMDIYRKLQYYFMFDWEEESGE